MSFINRNEPLLLWLVIASVIVLRVNVERTHYCSFDSVYYLEVANNILQGEGFVGPKVFDLDSNTHQSVLLYKQTPFGHPELYEKTYFTVWPLGYPVSIAAVSWVTTIDPLWASKMFNILMIVLNFYLLHIIFSGVSNLAIYYFGSYAMLEICSYTWSENLFLPFFLLFILSIKYIHKSEIFSLKYMCLLAFTLLGMSLARYAAVIFYIASLALVYWYYSRKESQKVSMIGGGLVIASVVLGLYLLNNYIHCGYWTGIPRTNNQEAGLVDLMQSFLWGILNQLHVIKQVRFSGTLDMFFYVLTVLIQLTLMGYIGYLLIYRLKKRFPISQISKLLIFTGSLYLIFLAYMTSVSTLDLFDYRTLLPFYFPVFMALFYEIEYRLRASHHTKAVIAIKIFFIISLLLNMPKKHLLEVLGNL